MTSLAAAALFGCGCASNIPFTVKHDKLPKPATTQTGTLAIKPFVDLRSVTNATQIGGKGKKAKPAYLAKQNEPVSSIVQDGFREALQNAGYRIETAPSGSTPVLEGDLTEFWLTDEWKAVCKITLKARLRSADQGKVLWEHQFHSEEDDLMIIPSAMTAAMTTLLKSATTEFSKPDFTDALKTAK